MEVEFIIKIVLGIAGAGLIAGGIVGVVRTRGTASKIWSVVAIAAGIVMWLFILFTTIVSSNVG